MMRTATVRGGIRGPVRRLGVVLLAASLLATLTGCIPLDRAIGVREVQEVAAGPFYRVPSPLPAGEPGGLIRSEPIVTAPPDTRAWRVLYHSRDLNGADIAVSGTVIVPDGPAPDGGRVVVSWGHPTTGAAPRCAPSSGFAPLDLIEGLGDLLAAGYAVVATDYPGMGAAGPSSYLLGASEGHSMLDIARAARGLPDVALDTRLLLWGHSQGGQAALFAAQEAAEYSPDLELLAVAVAAPAADLSALLDADIPDASGVTIASYAFAAYEQAYQDQYPGLSLDSILTPAGAAATPEMAKLCTFGQHIPLHAQAEKLVGDYLAGDPAKVEPWASMLKENSAGGELTGVPMLVAQGLKDTLVIPSATRNYAEGRCAAGEQLSYLEFPDATHATIALAAQKPLVAWFAGILDGAPTQPSCAFR